MLFDLAAEHLSGWLQSKLYRTPGLPSTDWQIIWVHQGRQPCPHAGLAQPRVCLYLLPARLTMLQTSACM